jgi:hypothetical protein
MVTSSISRICRLSLSEELIGVRLHACIHRGKCTHVYMSVCVCTVFRKEKDEIILKDEVCFPVDHKDHDTDRTQ